MVIAFRILILVFSEGGGVGSKAVVAVWRGRAGRTPIFGFYTRARER